MTLKYLNSSIIDAPERVIAHGCNLKGKMGAGVAAAIKDRWPAVFTAYQYACTSGGLYLGAVNWAERTPGSGTFVANVMTQNAYGTDPKIRYTSYDAVDKGLRGVIGEGKERGLIREGDSIAVPAIGAGLGNGRWSIIRELMGEAALDGKINFTVYEPNEARFKELTT